MATAEIPALRADARRNRTLILDAARVAFAEGGLEIGVAEIARRAGVGQGTLFRRFPTKEALILAVLEECIAELMTAVEEAVEDPDPWNGFAGFMAKAAGMQAADRGFFEAVATRLHGEPRLHVLRNEFHALVTRVLHRAQQAGVVRADVEPEDMPALVQAAGHAISPLKGLPPDMYRRYLGVILDGLRPGGATALHPPAPTLDEIDCAIARLAATDT